MAIKSKVIFIFLCSYTEGKISEGGKIPVERLLMKAYIYTS